MNNKQNNIEKDYKDIFNFLINNYIKIIVISLIFFGIFTYNDYNTKKNSNYKSQIEIYSLTSQSLYPYRIKLDTTFNAWSTNLSRINNFFSFIISGYTGYKSQKRFEIGDEWVAANYIELDSISLFDEFYFILKNKSRLREKMINSDLIYATNEKTKIEIIDSILQSINLKVDISQKFATGSKMITVSIENHNSLPINDSKKNIINLINAAMSIYSDDLIRVIDRSYNSYISELQNLEPSIKSYSKILFDSSSSEINPDIERIQALLSLIEVYKNQNNLPKILKENNFFEVFKPVQLDLDENSIQIIKPMDEFRINYLFAIGCFLVTILVLFILKINQKKTS